MRDWMPTPIGVLGGIILALFIARIDAQSAQKVVDVRFGQRTVAVSDPNHRTLTIVVGGSEWWVCAPHEGGRSCKTARDVEAWLLENGINH